ncbi:hypothetical protein H6G33_04160 [Calothrix sp. FACHB-1219]|uniref:hypothetical protein n=1 Tax=unclassified Calothrix TaxID=2619626 RepID=UPI0016862EF1|nr:MULTISPECIES: hypothetical protein [unclassified Calothrix]MBD2204953.1 hypothetical protein [Calothrix sp. FACHB-168]MBD2216222.1 hypothetical protein [Calothrix sp. FACHB-1219]
MNNQQQTTNSNRVVPFTGEFYVQPQPSAPVAASKAPYAIIIAAALVAGLAIGAISTYQSSDQVQLRQMKADAQQLEKLKTQVCR